MEADVPEYIATLSLHHKATEQHKAVGDMVLITFYYLLYIGEYTTKDKRPESKCTVEYKLEDSTFFGYNDKGQLWVIPRETPADIIAKADLAKLKLDNQKNGHKGVCVHHDTNGDPVFCLVRALCQRYLHLQAHCAPQTTTLSTYFMDTLKYKVTAENITRALKIAVLVLNYPEVKGILIARINIHSLQAAEQMPLPLPGTATHTYKRWGTGKVPHLNNTYTKNSHVSPLKCQKT